ncbi:MAG: RNB domain-containing ribonuclease [Chloroflexi bacterium]|nr:RNB domain-containing ribonuclease [Chloroflexota bacterium]MBU1746836.1 RNB domain-containing ribonuclease [Chloroflexota bacterium]
MTDAVPGPDSLVLYKDRPARVRQAAGKLTIELPSGETRSVRPKDVTLLHPGPLRALADLRAQAGEVQTAWELLCGGTTDLVELAELAYGAYTPATAWAAWQLVADGLYFRGTPAEVVARSTDEVAQEQARRAARAVEAAAWDAFIERAQAGQIAPADALYLEEVEAVALGQRDTSRVLRELGRAVTPENAHALLLELGHWDHMVDPYPLRVGVPTEPPAVDVPALAAEDRVDLTHLPALAIDDEGNQDPDDALSLDGSRLWVHVADVAALVPPDSPADREARARGATLYLPEGMVPMLPPSAVRSLGLGLLDVSPALSFGLDLDEAGAVVGVEVMPSWVRVTRLSYEEVEARLEEEPLLRDLHQLAQASEGRRRAQGAIELDLPEVRIRVIDGEVLIRPLPPLRSRSLVREAMLLAGEAVGRFALEHDIPLPYTIQAPPDIPDRPTDLAGMFAMRRRLQPSQQSTMPGPHAGLGLPIYVQATSPLRRYLDLVTHQQLRAYLADEALLTAPDVLERVGAAAAVTGSVRRAERWARRHWTLVYLMQHPDWRGPGVLVEADGGRGKVLLPELDLEARIRLRREYPLNSELVLVARQVDLPRLDVHWQLSR